MTKTKRKTKAQRWSDVSDATYDAHLIAFDGCHKIYLAMDEKQAQEFKSFNYETLTAAELLPQEMLEQLKEWYEASCFLKFISSVSTTADGAEFNPLIPQGV